MSQVVFYLLQGQQQARQQVACAVAAHHARRQAALALYTDSVEQAERLDKLLWTFDDTSFVPHALDGDPMAADVPIQIFWQQGSISEAATVLNLASDILADPVPARVIELVLPDAAEKTAARNRYRMYRDSGIEPEHVEATSLDMVQ